MRGLYRYLLPLLLAGMWAMPGRAAVTVTFVQPEQYFDAGFGADRIDTHLKEIERHLKRLGERYLQPADHLTIEVLGLDLAGRWEARRNGIDDPNIHVLRDSAEVPSIRLRYRLVRADGVEHTGEETYSDLGFLRRHNRYRSTDSLRYEKLMLDDWFAERIVSRLPAGR